MSLKKREGVYWNTCISNQVWEDAKACRLPEWALNQLLGQFHSLGNKANPENDPRVMQLRNEKFARGVLRFKTQKPHLLIGIRGLVLKIQIESRKGTLVLVGLFPRSDDTYDVDMPHRLAELDRR